MGSKRQKLEMEIYEALFDDLKGLAKDNLLAFATYINKHYSINWHHRVICERLSRLPYEKQKRIMIFMPPQTGKSEIVSRTLPAWMLGRNPDLRIILASYSADLAMGFCRDVQRILCSDTYDDIFPGTSISHKNVVKSGGYKRTANHFEIIDARGSMFSVGVGGSTTGKSADIFIIDDPFKDLQQAYSQTTRARVIDWYNSVAQTRLTLNGHIIIMHTRWHEADLAGYLLSEAQRDAKATQWEVISIPAIGVEHNPFKHPSDKRREGDPLWPEFKGDIDYLETVRKSVGEKVWSALYQQSPTIEGGNIIKEAWLKYYSSLPFDISSKRANDLIQSWDLTFKETGSSYVVGIVIAKHGADFYIIDCYRKKADIVQTMEAIKAMTTKYPDTSILIEDKANGPAVISMLKSQISRVIPVRPESGKDERLHVVAPLFEAGNVHFPSFAPWIKEVIHELQSFPNGANDDIVDAISQGLQHWNKLTGLRRLQAMGQL